MKAVSIVTFSNLLSERYSKNLENRDSQNVMNKKLNIAFVTACRALNERLRCSPLRFFKIWLFEMLLPPRYGKYGALLTAKADPLAGQLTK